MVHYETDPQACPEERVQSLLSRRPKNAKWTNCRLVLSQRSQFFHSRRFFSSQAKLRSDDRALGHDLEGVQLASWNLY